MAEFVSGIIVKAPKENAPSFVKYNISIKRGELIEWLESKTDDWVNAQLKESQQGKLYLQVDDWKPNTERQSSNKPAQDKEPENIDDDIPF